MSKQKKTTLILVAAVLILAILLGTVYFLTREDPVAGDKTITVEITHGDGTVNTVEIQTDAEYLRQALEQENLVAGEDGEFGLYILTMDGETADESLQQWWGYTKGGEYVETGIDGTVIADGDHFEFTFNTGW